MNRWKRSDTATSSLWMTDIRTLELHFERLLEKVTNERQSKIARYHFQDDKLRSLAAGLLLHKAFGIRTTEIHHNQYGKPVLDGGPFFNISHSGNLAILAIDHVAPIGCDIQYRKHFRVNAIVKTLFHSLEYQTFLDMNEEEQQIYFYRLWTLKESYQKMVGKGFSLPANRIPFELEPKIRLLETPENEPVPHFRILEDIKDYTLAICSSCDLDSITPVIIDEW